MKIELVSIAHVNGFRFYDVHCVIDGKDFTIVPVMYSTNDCYYYVNLPGKPLFITFFFCDLIDYLSNVIRELFKL